MIKKMIKKVNDKYIYHYFKCQSLSIFHTYKLELKHKSSYCKRMRKTKEDMCEK